MALAADRSAQQANSTTSASLPTTPEMNNSSLSSCGGAAILLSDDVIYTPLGDSVAMDCRAVGTTAICWVLPGHKVAYRRRIELPDIASLRSASGWLGSRVVSVLDSGAGGPGFISQSRRYRVTVLGKLFTPVVSLFTKQRNW